MNELNCKTQLIKGMWVLIQNKELRVALIETFTNALQQRGWHALKKLNKISRNSPVIVQHLKQNTKQNTYP